MRLVVIESPYRGKTEAETEANRAYARAAMHDSFNRGEAPFASHLLYTQPGILQDGLSDERQWGIFAALAWAAHADVTAVYTDRGISEGMHEGMKNAESCGRPIELRSLYSNKVR